jgi:hypothetical protein
MAYLTSQPPARVPFGITGTAPALWVYWSADPASDVDASGYFTNGADLGMKKGDLVFVLETDSTYQQWTAHSVVSVSATGVVDLSTGVSIGGAANAD